MRITILVNPKAGFGRDRASLAEKVLDQFPKGEAEIVIPRSREETAARAREAAAAGAEMVVAVGGDGTVREIASNLVGTDTVLGVLPLGSGNGFARGIGIGVALPAALETLRTGKDKAIDVGEVNGAPFFCVSGIGFDALVGAEFDRSPVRGFLPYFGIAARESLQYRPVEVSIRFDDRELIAKVFFVTVANMNQYGAGAIIAPKADPSDGLLDVVVVRHLSVFELIYAAPKLFDGSVEELSRLETVRSRSFRIVRAQSGPLHLDGEPVREGHVLDYRVRPEALRVRVPA